METSQGEEEFIDMEVNPSMKSKEFEFQMCAPPQLNDADELFYKGKLLPLHLPPRLQLLQKLLLQASPLHEEEEEETQEKCKTSPEDYMFQWSKKMRLVKQCSLSEKLKSSRAYKNVSKAKEYVRKYIKLVRKNPLGEMEDERHQVSSFTMKNILDSEMDDHGSFTCHRMSFSGAVKRHSTSKNFPSPSSFSVKSGNGFYEINLLKRSISANSEVENSIQGAIAHCKKSQQKHDVSEEKRSESEVGTCLISSSRVSDISRI